MEDRIGESFAKFCREINHRPQPEDFERVLRDANMRDGKVRSVYFRMTQGKITLADADAPGDLRAWLIEFPSAAFLVPRPSNKNEFESAHCGGAFDLAGRPELRRPSQLGRCEAACCAKESGRWVVITTGCLDFGPETLASATDRAGDGQARKVERVRAQASIIASPQPATESKDVAAARTSQESPAIDYSSLKAPYLRAPQVPEKPPLVDHSPNQRDLIEHSVMRLAELRKRGGDPTRIVGEQPAPSPPSAATGQTSPKQGASRVPLAPQKLGQSTPPVSSSHTVSLHIDAALGLEYVRFCRRKRSRDHDQFRVLLEPSYPGIQVSLLFHNSDRYEEGFTEIEKGGYLRSWRVTFNRQDFLLPLRLNEKEFETRRGFEQRPAQIGPSTIEACIAATLSQKGSGWDVKNLGLLSSERDSRLPCWKDDWWAEPNVTEGGQAGAHSHQTPRAETIGDKLVTSISKTEIAAQSSRDSNQVAANNELKELVRLEAAKLSRDVGEIKTKLIKLDELIPTINKTSIAAQSLRDSKQAAANNELKELLRAETAKLLRDIGEIKTKLSKLELVHDRIDRLATEISDLGKAVKTATSPGPAATVAVASKDQGGVPAQSKAGPQPETKGSRPDVGTNSQRPAPTATGDQPQNRGEFVDPWGKYANAFTEFYNTSLQAGTRSDKKHFSRFLRDKALPIEEVLQVARVSDDKSGEPYYVETRSDIQGWLVRIDGKTGVVLPSLQSFRNVGDFLGNWHPIPVQKERDHSAQWRIQKNP